MVSQITGNLIIVQQVIQHNYYENIKALHYWTVSKESTGAWGIPLTKGQLCGKHFHVIISSGTIS